MSTAAGRSRAALPGEAPTASPGPLQPLTTPSTPSTPPPSFPAPSRCPIAARPGAPSRPVLPARNIAVTRQPRARYFRRGTSASAAGRPHPGMRARERPRGGGAEGRGPTWGVVSSMGAVVCVTSLDGCDMGVVADWGGPNGAWSVICGRGPRWVCPVAQARPLRCRPGGAGAMAAQGDTGGDCDGGRAGRALPPHSPSAAVLQTVEMHTGGEPLRIIPRLEAAERAAAAGLSLLSLRREVAAGQDHVRRALMHEPRGHGGMYGALVVRGGAAAEGAHLAVLFLHCAGYSAMCGHAVMALGRFALDYGLVPEPSRPETAVRLRCPCGPVTAFVPWDGRRSGNPVRFHSVPAFAAATGGDLGLLGGLVAAVRGGWWPG